MKKIIILLLVAFIVPACVFAGRGFFDFTVGVTAQSSYSISDVKEGGIKDFSLDKLAFGADVETKVSIASVDLKVLYDKPNNSIAGMVCAHVSVDLLSMLRIKLGLGYEYGFDLAAKALYLGNPNGYVSELSSFRDACMDVNAGVDLLLGNVTIGANATLPTSTSIANGQWRGIPGAVIDGWKLAKLGVTIGYCLK